MFDRVAEGLEVEKLKDPFYQQQAAEKQSQNKSEPMIINTNPIETN